MLEVKGDEEAIERLSRCGAVSNLARGIFKDECDKNWERLQQLSEEEIRAFVERQGT